MSEAAETLPPEGDAPPSPPPYPPELEALIEATHAYAKARAKLPAPGKALAEKDAANFKAYKVALLAFERAGMAFVGRKVKQ